MTTIIISTTDGLRQVPAFSRDGDFAVHQAYARPGRWAISHLPSGTKFPCEFHAPEAARAALPELVALRPDWTLPIAAAEVPRLRAALRLIVERYDGRATVGGPGPPPGGARTDLNPSPLGADVIPFVTRSRPA